MSLARFAKRVDANQPGIVKELRKLGYSVYVGVDDILVGHNGKNYWFEIKDPKKTLNKDGTWKSGAIKESQYKLLNNWRGMYAIVYSIEQILEIIEDELVI